MSDRRGVLLLAVWNPTTTPGPVTCLSRLLAGASCPLCGATRGVALCLRGDVAGGSAFNPLAVPAVLAGVALMALWSREYVTGRQVRLVWGPIGRALFLAVTGAVFLATWAYVLRYRWEDDFASSWLGRLLSPFW
ncbi:MAG: DUF2752 domain-containing protein [Gemmataceae bacterium]